MAVQQSINKRTIALVLDAGVDGNGQALTKSYSYSGVKTDANPEDVLKVANAIASLYAADLNGVLVTEKSDLASM